jgi:hypothetical protein
MTRPTILDLDLVVVPREATVGMKVEANSYVDLGPADTFTVMLSASPYPTAWDDVQKYVEGLEQKEALESASLTGLLNALEHHTGERHGIMAIRHLVDRAEASEARIAELEKDKHAALTMIAMLEKQLAGKE